MYEEMVKKLQETVREAPLSMVPALFIVLCEEVVRRKALTDAGLHKVLSGVIEREERRDPGL